MNSTGSILTCSNIFDRYSLDFLKDITENDKLLILDAIQSFKNSNYKKTAVNFFEGREINILTEFFSRYGEIIRYKNYLF